MVYRAIVATPMRALAVDCRALVLVVWCTLSWLCCIHSFVNLHDLAPEEIAIVQYDSRKPLSNYWLASAKWNHYYCQQHGHTFIYYVNKYKRKRDAEWCVKDVLASPWCKVKAMNEANDDYPGVKVFIYMDSDAIIDFKYKDYSLNYLLKLMQDKLTWDPEQKPLMFNQDGPCWWCALIERVGYSMCLNAGTVVWYRHPVSRRLLQDWWTSAMDPYEGNPIKRRFRIKWPWEQDRQMAIYNRSSEFIQVASHPDQRMMDARAGLKDWCLSHLPGSGCFISHHCSDATSKKRLMGRYIVPSNFTSNSRQQERKPFGVDANGEPYPFRVDTLK